MKDLSAFNEMQLGSSRSGTRDLSKLSAIKRSDNLGKKAETSKKLRLSRMKKKNHKNR